MTSIEPLPAPHSLAQRGAVLMCAPSEFELGYAINPCMRVELAGLTRAFEIHPSRAAALSAGE